MERVRVSGPVIAPESGTGAHIDGHRVFRRGALIMDPVQSGRCALLLRPEVQQGQIMETILSAPAYVTHPKHLAAELGSDAELSPDLVPVAGSLHEKYDQRLGSDLVDAEINRIAVKFEDARVRGFVPLLVRRYAEQALSIDCQETSRPAGNRSDETGAGMPE